MPAFYPRAVPRQLPLTPPDYVPSYNNNRCGGRQAWDGSYAVSSNTVNQSDLGYEYPDQYGQQAALNCRPVSYQHPPSYNVALPTYSQAVRYVEPLGAPTLPPMRTQEYTAMDDTDLQRQQEHRTRVEQHSKGEKAVGGVSAQLDYDMEQMTDYVSEMAQGMYDLFTSDICIADIDLMRSIQPGVAVPPLFRKWVSQVLCATRLPSATILLSLSYLSARMNMLSVGGPYKASEGQIYRLLTIALVLGSKFLDDNTFQNRSWSEVSGIKVVDLNALEKEWLVAISFDLHRHPKEPQGFSSWLAHWLDYESKPLVASSRSSQARCQPSSIQRNRSLHGQLSSSNHLTENEIEEMLRQQQLAFEAGRRIMQSQQQAKLTQNEQEAMRQQQQAIEAGRRIMQSQPPTKLTQNEIQEMSRRQQQAIEAGRRIMQSQQQAKLTQDKQEAMRQQQQAIESGRRIVQSQQPTKLVVPEFDYTRTSQGVQHHPPTYAPYDPWCPRLMEHSPASQPQTDPTTPEYYGSHRQWGTAEGYSGRNNSFGFPPISHAVPPPPYKQPSYTPAFNDSCWSGYGYGCGCLYCARQQPSYLMSHGYRMQSVAG